MSTAAKMPTYEAVANGLTSLEALSGAAETHGLLCALLCGGANISSSAWLESLQSAFPDAQDPQFIKAKETLSQLFDATAAQLQSETCEVELLLPKDDEALHVRIQALAQWSQGFLSGLQLLGVSHKNAQAPDVKDALNHLLQISCLEYESDDEADAESESSYNELFEFARMAVLLIHSVRQQLFGKKPATLAGNNTVH